MKHKLLLLGLIASAVFAHVFTVEAQIPALQIRQGGTATSTQVANGVNFFDGTRISSGVVLVWNKTLSFLGIGTTTPQWLLQIASSTSAVSRPQLALTDSGAGTNLKHWTMRSVGGNLYIATSSDAYATATIPVLAMTSAGQVLADDVQDSQTSPAYAFFGDPDTGVFNGGANNIAFTTGGTNRANLDSVDFISGVPFRGPGGSVSGPTFSFSGDTDTGVWSPSGGALAFTSNGTEVFRYSSAFNVGIASTSPWRTFSVVGTMANSGMTGATGGTNNDICITASGDFVNETTGTCIVSSRKFKHDIQPLKIDSLSLIDSLNPQTFIRNDDPTNATHYGFIAEESADTDAHLASYGLDGEPRGLDEHAFLAVLWDAVRELSENTGKAVATAQRSGEENWQDFFIGLLLLYVLYNEWGKKRKN